MKKYFLTISLLFLPALRVLAHVGEEVEEYVDGIAQEAVQTGPAIWALVLAGILGAGIIGFLFWVIFKSKK